LVGYRVLRRAHDKWCRRCYLDNYRDAALVIEVIAQAPTTLSHIILTPSRPVGTTARSSTTGQAGTHPSSDQREKDCTFYFLKYTLGKKIKLKERKREATISNQIMKMYKEIDDICLE